MNALLRFQFVIAVYFLIASNSSFAQSNEFGETPAYTVQKEFISVKDGLASREVYCVAQDQFGFIWFGTKFGLNRYDGKNFKLFTTKDGLASNIISNLFINAENHLIIQYGNRWTPHNSTGQKEVFDVITFKTAPYNKLDKSATVLKKNNWINKYLDEDIIYKIERTDPMHHTKHSFQFGNDSHIYSMPENKHHLVYSEKNGLYFVEGDQTIKVLNTSDLFSGDQGRINYFIKDALGNLWICMPQGVYKIKYKKNYFHSYFTNSQQITYPWPQARGIWAETIAGAQQAVYANVMASVFSSKNIHQQKLSAPVWGILSANKTLYAFGFNLYELDLESLNIVREINWIAPNKELSLCAYQYSDSIFYVGTSSSIFAYNRFTQKRWVLPKISVKIPIFKEVYRITKTSKGIIAVAENGIYLIKNGKITDYFGSQTKDKNNYLPIQSALDIHEDNKNCLWIATNGEGLVKWEWDKSGSNQSTISYTIKDGLPSMILYRIEEDNFNNLWISTDEGVMRFNLKTEQIKLFKSEDGLPHSEFNRTSSFKSSEGWIYFGGMNGVVGFNPADFNLKSLKVNIPFHVVSITKFSKDKEISVLWSLNMVNQSIEWLPSDKLLKIDFALLDYEGGKKKFAYRIKGVQNEWIYTYDHSISIGNLPYGSHVIEIKAQLEDGTWLTNQLKIPINVITPFYLQAWFIGLVSLLIISLVIIIIWYRGKLLKAQNSKLENLVTKRTEDLNSALGDKDVLMKELHHRVKNNLQIITGLLELQKAQMTDKKAIEALTEGQIRLSSIALIHQNFYGGTNLESISFKIFLTDLLIAVKQLFENEQRIIECVIQTDDIPIDINIAIPLGLIVNELLTNSYKYLPAEQLDKKIEINLTVSENGKYEFTYKDNGPGLPPNVNFENSQTLGLRLISGLSEQINGSLFYKYDGGSVFVIQFKAKSTK